MDTAMPGRNATDFDYVGRERIVSGGVETVERRLLLSFDGARDFLTESFEGYYGLHVKPLKRGCLRARHENGNGGFVFRDVWPLPIFSREDRSGALAELVAATARFDV